jgi:uncharacterized protein
MKMIPNYDGISPLPNSVREFISSLSAINEIKRLIVFGSRACGDYEKYSDLDLAIDSDDLSREQWVSIRLKSYYEVKTVFRISIVNFKINPIRIQNHILNNGKIIYERK